MVRTRSPLVNLFVALTSVEQASQTVTSTTSVVEVDVALLSAKPVLIVLPYRRCLKSFVHGIPRGLFLQVRSFWSETITQLSFGRDSEERFDHGKQTVSIQELPQGVTHM